MGKNITIIILSILLVFSLINTKKLNSVIENQTETIMELTIKKLGEVKNER